MGARSYLLAVVCLLGAALVQVPSLFVGVGPEWHVCNSAAVLFYKRLIKFNPRIDLSQFRTWGVW